MTTSKLNEIYKYSMPTKSKIEEVCRLKQPTVFTCQKVDFFNQYNLKNLKENYPLKLMNVRKNTEINNEQHGYALVNTTECEKILESNKAYYSENNHELLRGMNMDKLIEKTNFFKPPMTWSEKHDLVLGGEGSHTPLGYSLDFREFLIPTSGEIEVKLLNPSSRDDIDIHSDYLNLEFLSSLNPWDSNNPRQPTSSLTYLQVGEVLFIPSYWLSSVRFGKDAAFIRVRYRTPLGDLANVQDHITSFLQNQNTSFKTMKTD